MAQKILLVDDDVIRHTFRDFLVSRGYEIGEADTCERAVAQIKTFHPDLVVLDYSLPDGTALDLLPRIRNLQALVPCILLTGFGSIELAVEAMKAGADHFLTKPIRLEA